jgi:hypothetical protein
MVLHNLHQAEMRRTLSEVERVLKPSGRAIFLTMHPDAFESQWDLQFLSYDLSALQRYRDAVDKEDAEVPGRARNIAGGENVIAAIYHSRCSVVEALSDAGLVLTDERDLWIDLETAVQMFGTDSIRRMPTTPTYWMLTLVKPGMVANGHADGATHTRSISSSLPTNAPPAEGNTQRMSSARLPSRTNLSSRRNSRHARSSRNRPKLLSPSTIGLIPLENN